jgi:MoaA/NifB/PqqE/SkfB family radical SAM enzyme
VFRGFTSLVSTIVAETGLSVSFTTNGSRLTPELLDALAGRIGQIQLSIYDDDDFGGVIDRLVRRRVRFGLNYLVTPARVRSIEVDTAAFVARGVRDILFLSYKGPDRTLHLAPSELERFDEATEKVARLFARRLDVKVDVCWGHRLQRTPQLFGGPDCGAGSLFLSLTSDRRVLACSFADGGEHLESVEQLPAIWARLRALRPPAPKPGCARLPAFGLTELAPPAPSRRALPLASFHKGA